ncbi:caspase-7-like [Ylistrum balloti]|uniref:caspase-7-like n=1 Tax=Ylistrum balloti TaxID=509963 RepID=UPI002905B84E|nr:caspase-7-like [Ylistrum balloti]
MDENWKGVLSRNFSAIVGHVDDPDAIAECLHYDWNPPVFTENDVQQVKSSTEDNKSKTRRLLNKLTYKTNYPLVALYNAFKLTSNVFLRELLVPYVQSYYKAQRMDIRIIPASRLPLQKDDWEDFHKKDVIMCEIESQNLLENYKDTVKNYMMTKETRGRAVIVNNFNFAGKKNRDGSDMDVRLLSNTLAQLHFDVKVHQDLTAEQIKTELERESRLEDHKSAQCFILVVMSHGTADGVEGTKEEVVPFQEFAIIFNPDNCPALRDKPKLFFFQSCRRKGPGISIDPNPRRMKEAMNNKDFLFAFATVQGKCTGF